MIFLVDPMGLSVVTVVYLLLAYTDYAVVSHVVKYGREVRWVCGCGRPVQRREAEVVWRLQIVLCCPIYCIWVLLCNVYFIIMVDHANGDCLINCGGF